MEMGEAAAMLQLTTAFICRTVQDLINVQRCCPWPVVPWQDISREAKRRGRRRGEGKETSGRRGRAGEEGAWEGRQGHEGSPLLLHHPTVQHPPGFPNKLLIAATFSFSLGCCEVTALFVMLIMSLKSRAAARPHEGW